VSDDRRPVDFDGSFHPGMAPAQSLMNAGAWQPLRLSDCGLSAHFGNFNTHFPIDFEGWKF
jgi:hypothetical protein